MTEPKTLTLSQLVDRLAAAERDIKTFGDPAYLAAKLVLAEAVVEAARVEADSIENPQLQRAMRAYQKAYKVEPPTLHSEAATQNSENLNISDQEGE